MEKLRKQRIEASILLEALLALAVFSLIAGLILEEIRLSRKEQVRLLEQEELLRAGQMALQSNQDRLEINGVVIQVKRSSQAIGVYHQGEELIHVEKK
ncbi:competence type IV pilus minor pilin ComGE [Streptococcus oricebi]|uniref:Type II secretory pathway, pseudopilin PulG n=1 Tax=Streptococcus oricebi TaxID=1547447 RepID=A0ABS5B451_9STRE|nr:competence type IV pilus minor pilin ComGE [Streptococcus oricebi]MBP2623607.1 hypothetical protein [Streptococcus oricebi]